MHNESQGVKALKKLPTVEYFAYSYTSNFSVSFPNTCVGNIIILSLKNKPVVYIHAFLLSSDYITYMHVCVYMEVLQESILMNITFMLFLEKQFKLQRLKGG